MADNSSLGLDTLSNMNMTITKCGGTPEENIARFIAQVRLILRGYSHVTDAEELKELQLLVRQENPVRGSEAAYYFQSVMTEEQRSNLEMAVGGLALLSAKTSTKRIREEKDIVPERVGIAFNRLMSLSQGTKSMTEFVQEARMIKRMLLEKFETSLVETLVNSVGPRSPEHRWSRH